MNATTGPTCQRCAVVNAPGAQFCANCGNGLSSAPPPPISPVRPSFSAGGTAQAQAHMAMDAPAAFNAALAALTASGAEILGQQPGQAIQFGVTKKDLMNTGGMKVRYTGELRFGQAQYGQTQPGQTQARISLKVDWSASMGIVGMLAICCFLFFTVLPLILAAYTMYTVSSTWPKKIADELAARLQMAAPGAPAQPYAPPPGAYTAPLAPQPPPPVETPAPKRAAELTPHEQLRKLKELFDLGALTEAEFNGKKTEILARL